MKKLYDLSKKFPILVGIVGLLVIYGSFCNVPADSNPDSYKEAVLRIVLAIACTGFIALISGDKILVNSSNKTGKGILMGIPIIMINGIFTIPMFFFKLFSSEPLVDGWYIQILLLAFYYLSVGFFEETLFRPLINDAILYQFRNKKGVFVAIALVSSLSFGIVHVWGSDIHNMVMLIQASLKTISSAMAGFLLLTVYWRTRNIVACAIIHGLCDFVPIFALDMFKSDAVETNYVMEGTTELGNLTVNMGIAQSFTYVIQIVLTIIAFLIMFKGIKKIDFKKIREEW